jgi:N-terminal acetyltransferase B complex catalytic subunit
MQPRPPHRNIQYDILPRVPFQVAASLPSYRRPQWPDRRLQCVLLKLLNHGQSLVKLILEIVLGKTESSPYPAPVEPFHPRTNTNSNYLPWHGHVTALTISPSARRLGYATLLTAALEQQCDAHNAWFVDLFVRAENVVAQELYKKMGYSVYRRVVSYYADDADAFDMRKPLSRDKDRETVRENGEEERVDPSEVW